MEKDNLVKSFHEMWRDEGLFVSQDPQTCPITIIRGSSLALNKKEFTMAFFNSAVGVLQTLVVALGAGLGIWGAINLLVKKMKAEKDQREIGERERKRVIRRDRDEPSL